MPLSSFTPDVRNWFERSFEAPTPAQEQAWPAIATGEHVLISAPTGSGKTLAAFLWCLDRLAADPLAGGEKRTRLVYGIKVSFANKDGLLKPGMTIEAKLPE